MSKPLHMSHHMLQCPFRGGVVESVTMSDIPRSHIAGEKTCVSRVLLLVTGRRTVTSMDGSGWARLMPVEGLPAGN